MQVILKINSLFVLPTFKLIAQILEIKTPYDPNFQFFTSGDDFSKYARLWTRGYDVYTPNRNLVAHDSQNKMFPVVAAAYKGSKKDDINTQEWVDNGMTDLYRDDTKENAKNRLDVLFGKNKEVNADSISTLTRYGLGLKRSLDQFFQFTGIDTRSNVVFDDRCNQLQWVPYTFDKDPVFTENDVWGDGPEIKFAGDSNIPLISGKVDIFESTSTISLSYKQNKASGKQTKNKFSFFIFGIIDYVLNRISSLIDSSIGFGHSYYTIKLILVAVPIVFVVVALALHIVLDENRTDKTVKRF